MPSYSTVLNNSGGHDKTTSFYANSSSAFVTSDNEQKTASNFPQTGSDQSHKFYHQNTENFYQNNEHLYTNDVQENFESRRGYNENNFYSNIGNVAAPQVPADDRSNRATRDVVYSNIEPAVPIPVPAPITKEKEIIYSNIQWNNKPENTYSNIPAAHNHGKL